MTRTLTPQDVEQLSAYLDGQLPVREKMLLELRLRDDPALQEELKALAHTHLVLRSLPKRRAPRNFTLTPAMLTRRAGLRLFPVFRLASALAGILLVLVFTGDLLLGGTAMSAVPEAVSSRPVVNQTEKMAAPENSAPMITWNTPATAPDIVAEPGAMGRGGGPASPTLAETEPAVPGRPGCHRSNSTSLPNGRGDGHPERSAASPDPGPPANRDHQRDGSKLHGAGQSPGYRQ